MAVYKIKRFSIYQKNFGEDLDSIKRMIRDLREKAAGIKDPQERAACERRIKILEQRARYIEEHLAAGNGDKFGNHNGKAGNANAGGNAGGNNNAGGNKGSGNRGGYNYNAGGNRGGFNAGNRGGYGYNANGYKRTRNVNNGPSWKTVAAATALAAGGIYALDKLDEYRYKKEKKKEEEKEKKNAQKKTVFRSKQEATVH